MRIIAGRLKGRRLLAPDDRTIRPTSDRAREALFNILEHGDPPLVGARFLDLFCGTGAVGLEAHSRGAAAVLLIDRDRNTLRIAEANLATLGALAGVRVLRGDATRLGAADEPFDLVFLDPPYRSGLARPALETLQTGGWLAPAGMVVVELAAGEPVPLVPGFSHEQSRRYGAAEFHFLRCEQLDPRT